MRIEERWEFIYDQINGINGPDVCQWVKDESSMDGAIGPLVEQVYQARDRICERLGAGSDGDPDIEALMEGFERLSRTCGKLMYYYGCHDAVQGDGWIKEQRQADDGPEPNGPPMEAQAVDR